MKKIKRVWEENKVLLVLAIILIVCLVVVAIVSLTYFYGSSDNAYGNRLDKSEQLPLNEKLFKDIEDILKEDEIVKSVKTKLQGNIVYVDIAFVDATEMDKAKEKSVTVVELFNEDELAIYDIEFTISSLSTADFVGYTLKGARNAAGSGTIVWGNYNLENEEVE